MLNLTPQLAAAHSVFVVILYAQLQIYVCLCLGG